jgi:hypothetical protein
MQPKKQKKRPNKFLVLTGISFQMGITIYIMVHIGKWLDTTYPRDFKLFTLIFTLFGVGISLYAINKQLQKINN